MNVFKQLLTVKHFREQQAEAVFLRQRLRRDAAENDYRAAQAELARHQRDAQRAEQDMYGDLCARVVKRGELMTVLENVAVWRNGEREKQETCETLLSALEQAGDELGAARDALREANQVSRKFNEMDVHRAFADAQALERNEEVIMDEVVSARWGRREWSDFTQDAS